MYVFYSVDMEYWPRVSVQGDFTQLDLDIQRDIYGATEEGEFGLRYQLDILDSEGLKGVFFIEPISALRVGIQTLRAIINLVESRGHSVELHLHTEWLDWVRLPPLSVSSVKYIKQLSEQDQSVLIAKALAILREAGLKKPVCAFRAGNFGAGPETLRALAKNGIKYDSSYNVAYLNSACDLKTASLLLQPQWIDGVLEIPISFFQDYPGHYRPTQLTAVSFEEMRSALESAERQGWRSFVIVSHGFELIKRNYHTTKVARPDYTVIKRFQQLINYLGQNKDKFTVVGFHQVVNDDCLIGKIGTHYSPLKGSFLNTTCRWAEQLKRRLTL